MDNSSNTTNINIRIDAKLKKDSETLFKELGLNMSTAINMFLTKCVNTGGIPFKVDKYDPSNDPFVEKHESILKLLESMYDKK